MTLRVSEVVIDCADHGAVVDFWAAALAYDRHEVNEQYVALAPAEREIGRPTILFQVVPEAKVVKNRVHLDFRAESMADEVARLVALGATFIAERTCGEKNGPISSVIERVPSRKTRTCHPASSSPSAALMDAAPPLPARLNANTPSHAARNQRPGLVRK